MVLDIPKKLTKELVDHILSFDECKAFDDFDDYDVESLSVKESSKITTQYLNKFVDNIIPNPIFNPIY